MRKINKDLSNVPASLNSKLTTQRRAELIKKEAWNTANIYASRYKMEDVKAALKELYHSKCAFCEQRTFAPQVEHFRPKSIYYWLAYSWDNLLRICPNCNAFKREFFEILGQQAIFENTEKELKEIHKLAAIYQTLEANQLIHPEIDDIQGELICLKNGKLESGNIRVNHTIQTCRLNRPELKDERKKIWDDLIREIKPRLLEYKSGNASSLQSIQDVIKDFKRKAENPSSNFIAFRQYCVRNYISTM